MMLNRLGGALRRSKNSDTPPVKSTMASQVLPPFRDSYEPSNLANENRTTYSVLQNCPEPQQKKMTKTAEDLPINDTKRMIIAGQSFNNILVERNLHYYNL